MLAHKREDALFVSFAEFAGPSKRYFVVEPDFGLPPAGSQQNARRLPELFGVDQELKIVLLHYKYVHGVLPVKVCIILAPRTAHTHSGIGRHA